jgi:hypothetical protein
MNSGLFFMNSILKWVKCIFIVNIIHSLLPRQPVLKNNSFWVINNNSITLIVFMNFLWWRCNFVFPNTWLLFWFRSQFINCHHRRLWMHDKKSIFYLKWVTFCRQTSEGLLFCSSVRPWAAHIAHTRFKPNSTITIQWILLNDIFKLPDNSLKDTFLSSFSYCSALPKQVSLNLQR